MAGSNITIKLDLQKLAGATVMAVGKNNTECIVIPIAMANLYKGTKGTYLDLTAIELTSPKSDSKDTHLVKQALSKEVFGSMTEEQKKAIPILGNAIDWGKSNSGSTSSNNIPPAAAPSWL